MLRCIRKHILTYKAERLADGVDNKTIAASLGFKAGTLYSRIKHPEGLTLVEVMRIANTLNISIPALLGLKEWD